RGQWSGPVRIERAPDAGAGNLLVQTPGQMLAQPASPSTGDPPPCTPGASDPVALTPGERARLLANGQAAAPRDAPLAVKEVIASGNQIVGEPYLYGAAHGLPLSAVAPAYDCSSS